MKFHQKKLSSGLRILTVPMAGTEAMTLLVLVGTGSKYETKEINGISHFLEHLFFKGTTHRTEPGEVNRALDRLGSEHNAFTSKELTGYWVKAATKHFDAALDIVSDILLDPLFKADEIEKERGVIIQEISMYEDMPQRKVAEVFEELLYGDQPAGWDIAGPKDTIRRVTRDQILEYRHRQYVAKNTWVIAAGNIDPKDAEKKIAKAFTRFKNGAAHGKKPTKESQSKASVKFAYKDTDTTHVVFGVRTFDMYDKNRYALQLLSTLLGGNASSRLFMEIREKLGLAYYAKAAAQHYTDTGYLAAMVGIPHADLERVTKKIVEIFRDIREKGFSDEEVAFAKDNLRGTLALSFESSDEIATFFGEQALFYPTIETPQDVMRRIEAVSARDMMSVAKKWFHPKHANLAVIGPHKTATGFDSILASL